MGIILPACIFKVRLAVTFKLSDQPVQGRIQDFEMGGQNIKKKLKNQILIQYLRDKQKKERRGLRKTGGGGGEKSPISPPLDPRLRFISLPDLAQA